MQRGRHQITEVPKEISNNLVRDFSKVALTYSLSKVDFEIHWFGSYGRAIPTIAWTAGSKVVIMLERQDVQRGSPLYLPRDADREFMVFLMFHELGHNFWPPESLIPAFAGGKLYQHEGRNDDVSVSDVTAQLVDIVVNTHMMNFEKISKHFPEYTGRSLFKSNLKWDYGHANRMWNIDDVNECRQRWNDEPDFVKWQLYFYHNETLPCPNPRILDKLKYLIAKSSKEPVWQWKNEFYPLWLDLIENYERH
jgi:hypothetical protein